MKNVSQSTHIRIYGMWKWKWQFGRNMIEIQWDLDTLFDDKSELGDWLIGCGRHAYIVGYGTLLFNYFVWAFGPNMRYFISSGFSVLETFSINALAN